MRSDDREASQLYDEVENYIENIVKKEKKQNIEFDSLYSIYSVRIKFSLYIINWESTAFFERIRIYRREEEYE